MSTHSLLSLVCVLVLIINVALSEGKLSTNSVPGGWKSVDDPNSDERIVSNAQYAVEQDYGDSAAISYIYVYSCKEQVVAGINYDMIVEVTDTQNECKVKHYEVYDRFGEKSLVLCEGVDSPCTSH